MIAIIIDIAIAIVFGIAIDWAHAYIHHTHRLAFPHHWGTGSVRFEWLTAFWPTNGFT